MSTFALRPQEDFASSTLNHVGMALPVFYGPEALTLDMASSHQKMYSLRTSLAPYSEENLCELISSVQVHWLPIRNPEAGTEGILFIVL